MVLEPRGVVLEPEWFNKKTPEVIWVDLFGRSQGGEEIKTFHNYTLSNLGTPRILGAVEIRDVKCL